ncbi:Zn-dependent exopeptidase M28 [Clostridium sporogenes]|uniref:M28 family metallopeptidase n=1 Tax=unclassified Clostridium TaxID=2614128 RepID=UPI0013D2618B|nr:Zn-dependent exopeptidase M28 [Clostridium sporogenes]NFS24214.1 Zn-dependent exopeptidase M28 [Clostridium sporogenes]
MKNFAKLFYITIILTFLCFSIQTALFIKSFNITSVLNNINLISSSKFKGRLPGSIENRQVSEYIKDTFKRNNLLPFEKDYFHNFGCFYPSKTGGNPYLKVIDSQGNLVKSYSYGKDFKEDMLNFRENTFLFSDKNVIVQNDFMNINYNNGNFLIYATEDYASNFRSSFVKEAPYNMYVVTNKIVFSELKDFVKSGCKIICFIPYSIKETELNNVVGYIKGVNPNNAPIIISSHFDHLGEDLKGTIYSGALDNASGTSFMLELVEYIKSLGTPDRDIIFVSFNAEEFGCLGSRAFVDKYYSKIKNATLLNFDMIGGSESVPLCIMGSDKDTANTPLIKELSALCVYKNVNFNYMFENASDHYFFREKGINAITFCDNDTSKIHTPKDKIEFINKNSIKRCYNVASLKIINSAFRGNLFYIYYKEFLIVSSVLLLIFIKRQKRYKLRVLRFK